MKIILLLKFENKEKIQVTAKEGFFIVRDYNILLVNIIYNKFVESERIFQSVNLRGLVLTTATYLTLRNNDSGNRELLNRIILLDKLSFENNRSRI